MSKRRKVVITGGSRGIGELSGRRLAGAGYHVIFVARSSNALQSICKSIREDGGAADWIYANLSNSQENQRVAEQILEKHGFVETWILNAGTSNNQLFQDSSVRDFEYELGVNYIGPVALLQTVLPTLLQKKRGRIVGISSITANVAFPGNATYGATKAALLMFLRNLAIELDGTGVDVTMVMPGLTDTHIVECLKSPLPRMDPERVAETVADCVENKVNGLLIPGASNLVVDRMFRLFPGSLDQLVKVLGPTLVPGYKQALDKAG